MKRSRSAVSGNALKAFRRRKVMTLGEVAELVHSSIHTARRRLKEWRAHTSYNQNGRYYALPAVNFTAAANDNSFLQAVDKTTARLSDGESHSVCYTTAV